MRKWILLLAALFLAPIWALAEPSVALDETAVVADMPCSWAQGYEPRVEGNTLILQVPVAATDMTRVTVALHADTPALSPLKTQGGYVTAYRNDQGEYNAQMKVTLVRGRINGDYPCTLRLTGTTKTGSTVRAEYPFILHIRDGKNPTGDLRPMLSDVSANLVSGSTGNLTLNMTNPSAYAALTGLVLKVTEPTGTILPAGTDTLLLPDLSAGASMPVEVPLIVKENAPDALHALTLTLQYTALDANGTWTETFTIPVLAADEETEDNGIHPMLSDVDAALNVGEASVLSLELTNPSAHAEMTGITLKVTDATGDILPQGSDTLHLADVSAGETVSVQVPLTVRPTAAVSLHVLRFDIGYQAQEKSLTWSEAFTLPVNQEIRLEQGGVALSPTILQGELATLTLPLMNMGRGELRNVMVTLELPGITDRQSVLVGTIPAGETKQARLTFTPGKAVEGFFTGTATVSAEDAYGNDTSFVLPVETTVEKAPELNVAIQAQDEQHDTWWLTLALAIGCGVLMFVCILQGMLLRRKIRKLEEARL